MNMELYQLCHEYCTCFSIVNMLISIAGVESERLNLFRLMQTRMRELEHKIETCLVENDLTNQMMEKKE